MKRSIGIAMLFIYFSYFICCLVFWIVPVVHYIMHALLPPFPLLLDDTILFFTVPTRTHQQSSTLDLLFDKLPLSICCFLLAVNNRLYCFTCINVHPSDQVPRTTQQKEGGAPSHIANYSTRCAV